MNYTRKRALLACDFCRHRKRRCDGKKPCFTCRESNADCVYQELPSDRIEDSGPSAVIDRLSRIESLLEQQSQQIYQLNIRSSQSPYPTSQSDYVSEKQSEPVRLLTDVDPSLESSTFLIPKNHAAVATTLLAFPQIREVMGEYPRDYFFQVEEKLPLGLLDQVHSGPLTWPPLSADIMNTLAASYFQHVHPHQPLFTPRAFRSWQTRLLESHDLDGVTTSICLSVCALGALSSAQSSHQKAPDTLGLEYFQPSIKIMIREVVWGFRPNILACQALLLASSYFAHLGRPLHSLRMAHFASRLFLNILESRENSLTYTEPDDDEVRVYWQCFMIECDGTAELDTSRSGIEPLGDRMPLPQSLDSSDDRNHIYSIAEHAIRRLLNRILSALYNPETTHRYSILSPEPIRVWQRLGLPKLLSLSAELNRQLEEWYRQIPDYLRFPKGTDHLASDRPRILRIRYYTARHLIHRPFLLQTISRQQEAQSPGPSSLPESDPFSLPVPVVMERCEACIDSCVTYLHNAVDMIDKRSPYLWTFSQNCMAALVVLWLADNSAPVSHLVPAMQPIQNVVLDKLRQWAIGDSSFDATVQIMEQLIFSDRS
ncbi:hypothetical protein F4777DRAFT_378028 [Nemania sp. FL0916]|nr:hypothetical protein F4777DRAFT_378028 [Nemania sp. FL0916]